MDGAIHKAAGSTLVEECELLNGCGVGFSKITGGISWEFLILIYFGIQGKVSSDFQIVSKCCI